MKVGDIRVITKMSHGDASFRGTIGGKIQVVRIFTDKIRYAYEDESYQLEYSKDRDTFILCTEDISTNEFKQELNKVLGDE